MSENSPSQRSDEQRADNQWVRSRAFVGEHLYAGHPGEGISGCMICVAFRWGQQLGQMSHSESRKAWKIAAEVIREPDGQTHADR